MVLVGKTLLSFKLICSTF